MNLYISSSKHLKSSNAYFCIYASTTNQSLSESKLFRNARSNNWHELLVPSFHSFKSSLPYTLKTQTCNVQNQAHFHTSYLAPPKEKKQNETKLPHPPPKKTHKNNTDSAKPGHMAFTVVPLFTAVVNVGGDASPGAKDFTLMTSPVLVSSVSASVPTLGESFWLVAWLGGWVIFSVVFSPISSLAKCC